MNRFRRYLGSAGLHAVLLGFVLLTMVPFAFVINSSLRSTSEIYHTFFGVPKAARALTEAAGQMVRGEASSMVVEDDDGVRKTLSAQEAVRFHLRTLFQNYRRAWTGIRPYMINSLVVCMLTAAGVLLLSSLSAYVLSRYRFFGSRLVFFFIISTMMFPGVLTLVPSFMLVRQFGLMNSYWGMIVPYLAGGQVFGIFVMKSFFDGLPEDLFEAARIDGAGPLQAYRHIVIPLSKPVLSVVLIINVLGTWNNFLWPFIVNSEGKYHTVASGLYVLATSIYAGNVSTLFAAYVLSSIPLLILFVYATRPFIQGVTSGAFKA
jgi:ABC-type glycerol-3-phosphate transport system permease component